jgi:hypothetical protein
MSNRLKIGASVANYYNDFLLFWPKNVAAGKEFCNFFTLSHIAVGPFGHTPIKMQNTLKVLKARCITASGRIYVINP